MINNYIIKYFDYSRSICIKQHLYHEGSILGPLFTNELTEVIHDHDHGQLGGQDKGDGQEEGWPAYNLESVYQGN